MCLITDQQKPLKAEEGIVIYKLLSSDLTPMFNVGKPYELNKLYKTKMKESDDRGYLDDHAIDYWNETKINRYDLLSIGQGYHSFLSLDRIRILCDQMHDREQPAYSREYQYNVICKGIIPAGSLYYKDHTDLIVSDQIILQEQLSINPYDI